MTPQNCAACDRKVMEENKYCSRHLQAFESINNHYKSWMSAYGTITIEDFMNRLFRMNETGSWIKEVIAVELKNKK